MLVHHGPVDIPWLAAFRAGQQSFFHFPAKAKAPDDLGAVLVVQDGFVVIEKPMITFGFRPLIIRLRPGLLPPGQRVEFFTAAARLTVASGDAFDFFFIGFGVPQPVFFQQDGDIVDQLIHLLNIVIVAKVAKAIKDKTLDFPPHEFPIAFSLFREK